MLVDGNEWGSETETLFELAAALNVPVLAFLVNGGAIALGHPVGASGARLLLTLSYELKRRNKRFGLASLCIGGGQGISVIIENVNA